MENKSNSYYEFFQPDLAAAKAVGVALTKSRETPDGVWARYVLQDRGKP
jgi:hypothetical protein